MSRKKTARRIAKRQSPNKNASITQKMEQEFMRTPAKLSAQLNKDIIVLKQKENKLKAAFNKQKSQVKNSENRINVAALKTTAMGKKQLKKAKKAHSALLKNQAVLNKQLNATTKLLHAAMDKQAKLAALKKQLNQFEKDWAKSAKKVTVKDKAKARPRKVTQVSEPIKTTRSVPELPQVQNFETSIGDGIVSERTEITS